LAVGREGDNGSGGGGGGARSPSAAAAPVHLRVPSPGPQTNLASPPHTTATKQRGSKGKGNAEERRGILEAAAASDELDDADAEADEAPLEL
jgi:hypothetical protein